MPLTPAVVFDEVVAGIQAQKEQDRLAGREFVNQHMHRRPGESRDDFALRLQINRPQTVEGFFI